MGDLFVDSAGTVGAFGFTTPPSSPASSYFCGMLRIFLRSSDLALLSPVSLLGSSAAGLGRLVHSVSKGFRPVLLRLRSIVFISGKNALIVTGHLTP